MKDKYEVIEEDGIVVFDESDDYDPGEDEENQSGSKGFQLKTNEEIFTDEYMHEYARKMDEKIANEKLIQRFISVGVIVAVSLYIGFITFICFRSIK